MNTCIGYYLLQCYRTHVHVASYSIGARDRVPGGAAFPGARVSWRGRLRGNTWRPPASQDEQATCGRVYVPHCLWLSLSY